MRNKLKTHKATAKRVWRSGTGKYWRRHAMSSHHKGRENVKQSSRRRPDEELPGQNPRISELIPYQ